MASRSPQRPDRWRGHRWAPPPAHRRPGDLKAQGLEGAGGPRPPSPDHALGIGHRSGTEGHLHVTVAPKGCGPSGGPGVVPMTWPWDGSAVRIVLTGTDPAALSAADAAGVARGPVTAGDAHRRVALGGDDGHRRSVGGVPVGEVPSTPRPPPSGCTGRRRPGIRRPGGPRPRPGRPGCSSVGRSRWGMETGGGPGTRPRQWSIPAWRWPGARRAREAGLG